MVFLCCPTMANFVYFYFMFVFTKIIFTWFNWGSNPGPQQMKDGSAPLSYIGHRALIHYIINTRLLLFKQLNEPWSSSYGMRLMFQWSWVWIPAPYTGWTFLCVWNDKNKRKRGWEELQISIFQGNDSTLCATLSVRKTYFLLLSFQHNAVGRQMLKKWSWFELCLLDLENANVPTLRNAKYSILHLLILPNV